MKRPVDVLLIEPNQRHAQLIQEALAKTCKPCSLEILKEPDEARRFIDGGPKSSGQFSNPFLIIAELMDPKQPRAAELLRWLKSHVRTKHLPVIVLAVKDDPESLTLAYDLGISSYLVKPQDETKLGELVATAVNYWIQLNHPPD